MAKKDTSKTNVTARAALKAMEIKCRYCGSLVSGATALTRSWYRVPENKLVAGVCAGLAEEFGISVTIIRLAFVLGVIVGWGMGLVLYIVLWVIMPFRPTNPTEVRNPKARSVQRKPG